MQFIDALVCPDPAQLQIEQRPAPRAEPGRCAGAAAPRRHLRHRLPIFEGKHPYPAISAGHGPRTRRRGRRGAAGFRLRRPARSASSIPTCPAGTASPAAPASRIAASTISVLGVHQDGGMTGLCRVPAGNLVHAPGLTADQCADGRVSGDRRPRRAARRGERAATACWSSAPVRSASASALFARVAGATGRGLRSRSANVPRRPASIAGATTIAGRRTQMAPKRPPTATASMWCSTPPATRRRWSRASTLSPMAAATCWSAWSRDPITFMDPDFHRKEMTLLGSRNATSEDFERVMAAIRDGAVPVDRLITHRTSLADAVDQHPACGQRKRPVSSRRWSKLATDLATIPGPRLSTAKLRAACLMIAGGSRRVSSISALAHSTAPIWPSTSTTFLPPIRPGASSARR